MYTKSGKVIQLIAVLVPFLILLNILGALCTHCYNNVNEGLLLVTNLLNKQPGASGL